MWISVSYMEEFRLCGREWAIWMCVRFVELCRLCGKRVGCVKYSGLF